jgi:hypothetical protein
MTIEEIEISTLSEFVKIVEDVLKTVGTEIWFRGVSNSAYKLEPTLFRHKKFKTVSDINDLEKKIIEEFTFKFHSYVDFSERDRWDLLFLMQHYRIPTRLLDWTSSPFSGLFFALDGNFGDNDAIVWVLDPSEWNRGVLEDIGGDERIYPTSAEDLNQYHPLYRTKSARGEPLAIQGQVNNPRITAQKGKFVVFGQKVAVMESFETQCEDWKRIPLRRIKINKKDVKGLKDAIFEFGITHTSIYPDLEGLAMEIRFKYGFSG